MLVLINASSHPQTSPTLIHFSHIKVFLMVVTMFIFQVDFGILTSFILNSDGACQNIVGAVGVRNGYCLSPDQTISYKVEYPDESIYFKSADCTGEVQSNEIASTSNVCYARSDLKTSIKQLFIQNNQ
mmetsp:Transcript_23683/g.25920  ORF Transcript_23683/g.25920 Transcript_23683/m.25920 type:complete len:128 (-) Transcript_23683:290-673(-)